MSHLIEVRFIRFYSHLCSFLITFFFVGMILSAQTVQAISGSFHVAVLTTDSRAKSWGYNADGQLGDGTQVLRYTATNVKVSDLMAVSAGGYHSLGLTRDGRVWSWGFNNFGQLGDGSNIAKSSPIPVAGLAQVVAIAGGSYHSIALKDDGTVWSWGQNASGQLGMAA